MTFKPYRRKQIAELRPYEPGENLFEVSISAEDQKAGSPKPGDMIARNPKNHKDQWLVAAAYFAENFEALSSPAPEVLGPGNIDPKRWREHIGNIDGLVYTEHFPDTPDTPDTPDAPEELEVFGYWCKHKLADGVLLRSPSYIPEASDKQEVSALVRQSDALAIIEKLRAERDELLKYLIDSDKAVKRAEAAEARLAEAVEVLRPFADTADHDIGSDEADSDTFHPMTNHNSAAKITVGDMRRARTFLQSLGKEG